MAAGPGRLEALDRLIAAFGRLPGVGAKTAERLAHHILKSPPDEALALADALREVKERVHHCRACFHLTESDQDLCTICRDASRDAGLVCVVEGSLATPMALERAGTYQGRLPRPPRRAVAGVGPDQLTVDALEARVGSGEVREVIMATNPNLEGDGTAMLVATRLAETGVPITRLARGLASGSVLEFANKEMLADALSGRQRF